ncbi:hypothetical protein H5410_042407, partial [Solanum commersonii]
PEQPAPTTSSRRTTSSQQQQQPDSCNQRTPPAREAASSSNQQFQRAPATSSNGHQLRATATASKPTALASEQRLRQAISGESTKHFDKDYRSVPGFELRVQDVEESPRRISDEANIFEFILMLYF